MMLKTAVCLFCLGLMLVLVSSSSASDPQVQPGRNAAEAELAALHDAYLARYKPLVTASELAWWEASVTGTDEAFGRRKDAENKLVDLHSDRATFARLKALKDSGQVEDAVLKRELDVMYRAFLPGQADPELQKRIVALEADVEQIFNTHRSSVDGKPHTENDVRKILSSTTDSATAEKAWKGYMEVGGKVEGKLAELVRLRNQVARELGFRDFFALRLAVQEIDEKEFFALFDELDELTREPFAALKKQIDENRAARFGIPVAELRPWHFGDLFFQEAPELEEVNLDELLADRDPIEIAKTYYASFGMPLEDILARSDLYEKDGKSPHAFCTDIDRAGDIRILCNIKPNSYWMDTVLHELGHAVYDKYIDRDVPFILHTASHSITTEGIAMMLGAMSKNEEWLTKALGLPADRAASFVQAARRALRAEKIIFSRWTQVMVRFEHGMYGRPDQDLGKLWWELKKRYQLLNPPEDVSRPDYGAKAHIVGAPVYYHSYMMGDLFASQVQACVAKNVLGLDDPTATSFFGSKEAGDYLREKIFGPGNLYSWNELTRRATGEPLTAKYFAQQYIR